MPEKHARREAKSATQLPRQLLAALDINVPIEDLPYLETSLLQHLALMHTLDELDLWEIDPAFRFDPSWHD
jgi:hypothetical protein